MTTKIPKILLELGYPTDLPPLPGSPEALLEPELPSPYDEILRWTHRDALKLILDDGPVYGAGLAQRDDQPAVFLLLDPAKQGEAPKSVRIGRHELPTVTRATPPQLAPQAAFPPVGPFASVSGDPAAGVSLSADDDDPTIDNGTYSGTFGGRGLTAAHVALGFGFIAWLNNLPASVAWLLRSPRGRELFSASSPDVGQDRLRLFEVDTPWPILVWIPWATPGPAATFLYLDVAVGDARPRWQPLPGFFPNAAAPPPADDGAIITGATMGTSAPLWFGDVYGLGQELGLRWGSVLANYVTLALPIPIPGFPVIIIFNLHAYDLDLAPGDSGMTVIAESGDRALGIAHLGLGGTLANPTNDITLATPIYLAALFGAFTP